MNNPKIDTKTEIKLLPYTLGKLAGGAAAVAGLIMGGMYLVIKLFYKHHEPDPSILSIILFFLLGIAGIGLFLYFDIVIKNKLEKS